MENCILRFPTVGAMILNNLDDYSLVRSKEISRKLIDSAKMKNYIGSESFRNVTMIEDMRRHGKRLPTKFLLIF